MKTAEQDVTHQPVTSFPISFQDLFNRAGGRTLNVRYKMKNLRWPLRLLILTCIAFGAGSLVVDHATQDSLPSSLRDFYYSGFFDQHPAVAIGMGIVFVGLMVFSWIGLWFFWNPARYTYAIALTVTWITSPLLGPSVSTAWGGTFEEASTMAAGAILLMIFFGDQRTEFEKANKACVATGDNVSS